MPEPIQSTVAAITLAATSVTLPMITAFGIPLGLRADMLVAGFAGALVSIILLNTVPSSGDTWQALIRSTLRRMMVCMASSLTAGYLTPVAMIMVALPDALVLGGAFAVGGGAQQVLLFAIARMSGKGAAS